MKNAISLRVITSGEELENAADIIKQTFYEHFGTTPSPPALVCVAIKEGGIVGTLALDFDTGGALPFERIFTFPRVRTPWPYDPSRCVQFGRWTARAPLASSGVAYGAAIHAIGAGKTHGFCIAKPAAEERIRAIGVDIREVPGALLDEKNIAHRDQKYYFSPPPARLFMVELAQMIRGVRLQLAPLIASGEIILD